jgi:glycosyltransferase involved in cell wall biosynthesis
VLFVVNQARFFVTHRLVLAEAAAHAGYDVHVAVPDGPGTSAITERGFPVHSVPFDRGGMNVAADLRTATALVALYRELRPDLVHHVTVKPVLYGSLAARALNVRAVVNAVSGLGYLEIARDRRAQAVRAVVRRLYRLAFRRPRLRVIFQNPDDRASFEHAGIVRPGQASLIHGSGVDLDAFAPVPVPQGPPVVLLPARMLWDKGVGEFVDAARRLRSAGSDARFVLVGDTHENPAAVPADRLAAWVREGVVEWWGHRDDMPAALSAASVVCLPSYREGCPKALLEAAACGRPIVTTDVPGCRDVVRDGVEGLLVPARDAGSLAAAIARLLDDAELRRTCGELGRARAERDFGVARVVAATLTIYRELLADAAPTREGRSARGVVPGG